jgi:hypothetical protein
LVTTLPSRCFASQVDLRIAAEAVEDVEAAAATATAELVAGVGNGLELGHDELRHDELIVDDAGLDDVGDAAVDHHARVEDVGLEAFDFLRELDVRDDEAEVVLGLQKDADARIADDGGQRDLGPINPFRFTGSALRQQRREGELEDIGKKQANDRAEIDGRNRVEAFAADGDVGD